MTRMTTRLRRARPGEADLISAVAMRSKAYWGYSAEFLAACEDELTFTEEDCLSEQTMVAEVDEEIAGFFMLGGTPPVGELRNLFVDPAYIGTGIGRILLVRALSNARADGFTSLVLDSDPGAENFYARFGARRVGEVASGSIAGRMLPQMQFVL